MADYDEGAFGEAAGEGGAGGGDGGEGVEGVLGGEEVVVDDGFAGWCCGLVGGWERSGERDAETSIVRAEDDIACEDESEGA